MRFFQQASEKRIRYSMAQISLFFLLLLVSVILVVFSSISSYYNQILREEYYSSSRDTLQEYLVKCQDECESFERYLTDAAVSDNEYLVLNHDPGSSEFYHSKMIVYMTLRRNSFVASHLGGLFLFSPNTREYTCYSGASAYQSCFYEVREYLWNYLDASEPDNIFQKWHWLDTAAGSFMVHFARSENGIVGVWISYQDLKAEISQDLPQGSVICLYDPMEKSIDEEQFGDFTMDESGNKAYQIYQNVKNGEKYLVISVGLQGDYRKITIFTPLSEIDKQMIPIYKRLGLVVFLLLVTLLLIALAFKYLVDLPITSLQGVLRKIEKGEEDIQIPENSTHIEEIEKLNQVLNGMVTDIRNLKIDIYEEQLDKAALEIQMLKSQISPHFLINCLNTFGTLACSQVVDQDKIEHLIYTLTQYIRYSFLRKDTSSLAHEFEEVSNYMELVDMRYPECLTYRLALFPDCKEFQIPPMILLTLCENTIKHNMIMGEQMTIRIRAQREGELLHISYVDSGTGYTDEVLEINNHILDHLDRCMDGHHVGIYYIVRSLNLIYREKAKIVFSNEPGMGARADIYIPITGEEDNECTDR